MEIEAHLARLAALDALPSTIRSYFMYDLSRKQNIINAHLPDFRRSAEEAVDESCKELSVQARAQFCPKCQELFIPNKTCTPLITRPIMTRHKRKKVDQALKRQSNDAVVWMDSLNDRFPHKSVSLRKHKRSLIRNYVSTNCLNCGIECRWTGSERSLSLIRNAAQSEQQSGVSTSQPAHNNTPGSKTNSSKKKKKSTLQAMLKASSTQQKSSSSMSLDDFLKRV